MEIVNTYARKYGFVWLVGLLLVGVVIGSLGMSGMMHDTSTFEVTEVHDTDATVYEMSHYSEEEQEILLEAIEADGSITMSTDESIDTHEYFEHDGQIYETSGGITGWGLLYISITLLNLCGLTLLAFAYIDDDVDLV